LNVHCPLLRCVTAPRADAFIACWPGVPVQGVVLVLGGSAGARTRFFVHFSDFGVSSHHV
ncbi:MAG: hypothetical protein MUD05_06125, partial [Candidatus Nanopelagicales bacterium]|nr:hypothetical protein [Candidatus Nanopelagicales bacterium]